MLAFFFPEGFGIGVGSLVMLVNVMLLTTYTFSCHSLRHLVGGKLDCFSCTTFGPPRHGAWRWVSILNEHHMLWAWMSLFSVGLTDLYIRLVSCGLPQGHSNPVTSPATSKYETHENDVLIIGAGGAGLRAAIEALAQGASVGVVCKSLLGKAHTVMAEGGIAAAMGNVDTGGRLANAFQRHDARREIPEQLAHGADSRAGIARPRPRTRAVGRAFRPHPTGDILQRAFGGHTFKRLCHVGDRTGLEMIRTLQDRGVQQGIDVYMECTDHARC